MKESDLYIAYQIKTRIQQTDPDAKIILFGSRARGKADDDSDWDVLVLIDHPLKNRMEEKKYRHPIFDLELEIEQPISVFVVTKSDWENKYIFTSLYKSIQQEGVTL